MLSTTDLLDTLRRFRLLEPAQLDDLSRKLQGRTIEARALSQKLIERGWLMPYQVNQLLQGRGQDLVLGSYILLERLGQGGMGTVFKARHQQLGRVVALKVIRKERLQSPDAVKRFHREVRAAAKLSHPNIVVAFDADEAGGTHFLAMEYVEGTDLAKLIKEQGPLSLETACDYIRQAALGLQHAFERGMVHRDIKPHNLLLALPAGGGASKAASPTAGIIKILDMGLARFTRPEGDEESSSTLTQEGSVMGTLDYLAPEQAKDSHSVDIRADLYSLGCTFYQLLAGSVPFPGGSTLQKMYKHQWEEPKPVEQLRPDVPPGVAAVVRKLLAKKPEERFQTPAELAAVLASGVPALAQALSSREREDSEKTIAPLAGAFGSEAAVASPPLAILVDNTVHTPDTVLSPRPRDRKRLLFSLAAGGSLCLFFLLVLVFLVRPGASRDTGKAAQGTPATRLTESKVDKTNSLNMKFVLIRPGKFQMGSPEHEPGRQLHEGPQHKVVITKPFYMGIHEVTVGQFRTFVEKASYQTDGAWQNPGFAQNDSHPVVNVSWFDAVEFCKWLGRQEPRSYRLPTEAEWEYGCRAGTNTMYYSITEAPEACIWHNNNSGDRTNPVGQRTPNAWGLYDMLGNAWEWTTDWYESEYYQRRIRDDPTGPAAGTNRVLRGGGWKHNLTLCRAAYRDGTITPSYRDPSTGFRVVFPATGVP